MCAATLEQRLQLVVTPDFLVAVDDWRRTQPRIPSRSAAIRDLVVLGLQRATADSTTETDHLSA